MEQKVSRLNGWFAAQIALCRQRFFARRMQTIPSGWAEAWEKAAQHHDPVRMQQEKIKLDTAAAIKARFADVWEGAE